jgi:transposase
VIPVAIFDTIRHWRSGGLSRREIARRLHVDVKTVRRNLAKIEAGATAPVRISPGSKLDPYRERIRERVEQGCTAWTIYVELRTNPEFDASYELVKKYVAALRYREPQVFERLEHPPGAEAQADFGELVRVKHEGQMVRTWAYVTVWPHSTWRYAEVVLEQQVPTFLSCVQNGFIAAEAVPERFSIDNLRPGVFWKHFGERAYQRDFASLCAHYDTLPNAVRPRRPTDKGAVENGVGALKKALRGRNLETLDELRAAVAAWVREMNARPNSRTGKRPNDLIALERRGPLPERYPLAFWSEHRARTDCHVQVRSNFYSVPYQLVGRIVVARVDATSVTLYKDLAVVARHERCLGRGQSVTDRRHYPEHKRKSTQEIHHERIARIRSVGGGAAAFYSGLLRSREHVHSDAHRALVRLIERSDASELERACARAAHFGNYTIDALRAILERRLFELPLDDLSLTPPTPAPQIALVRPLAAYAELLGGGPC